MKADLRFYIKDIIEGRYILELSIHNVGKSNRYPDGVKYGLICFDTKTRKRILMDNHHPKGHHIHIDDTELDYEYVNDEKLIDDFNKLVLTHLGVKI